MMVRAGRRVVIVSLTVAMALVLVHETQAGQAAPLARPAEAIKIPDGEVSLARCVSRPRSWWTASVWTQARTA